MCHGDSDEEAPWSNRRSPRPRSSRKLQAKGRYAWEDPQSPEQPDQKKQSPQQFRDVSGAQRRGSCRTSIRSDIRPPAAVGQEIKRQGKSISQQKSTEELPIWEDAESDVASSLARECDGGAIVTKIPKQYRLSFPDENTPAHANVYHQNPDRWSAMKIATQQAAMREEAAISVLHKTPRSQSFLPPPPVSRQETARTVIPHSQSYLPPPPSASTFSTVCPPSPSHCLTVLPPAPPRQRDRSLTPQPTPRCQTIWPLESPRPQDVQPVSCVSSRRGSPSPQRTRSINRVATAAGAPFSQTQALSPGPPRRKGRGPHGIPSAQSPVASRMTSSRGPSMSPTHSFFGSVCQHQAWQRPTLSFQPPPATDMPSFSRSRSAHSAATPAKIGTYSQGAQALSSPS